MIATMNGKKAEADQQFLNLTQLLNHTNSARAGIKQNERLAFQMWYGFGQFPKPVHIDDIQSALNLTKRRDTYNLIQRIWKKLHVFGLPETCCDSWLRAYLGVEPARRNGIRLAELQAAPATLAGLIPTVVPERPVELRGAAAQHADRNGNGGGQPAPIEPEVVPLHFLNFLRYTLTELQLYPPSWRRYMLEYVGLNAAFTPRSPQQIAKMFGVGEHRVRQALAKMRLQMEFK